VKREHVSFLKNSKYILANKIAYHKNDTKQSLKDYTEIKRCPIEELLQNL